MSQNQTFKGIDISTWQKPALINYDILAKEIDFAILRVGYTGSATGRSYAKDAEFETHYAELSKRGVPIGVYWFARSVSPEIAVQEANEVLKHIRGKKIEFPIYYDTEDNVYQRPAGRAAVTAAAKAFCERIEKAGYYVGIYASASWFRTMLDMSQLSQFDTWVAHYGVSEPGFKPAGMWQYTDKGRLPGYSGNLDLNIAYRDYKRIIANAKLNHLEAAAPTPAPAPKPSPQPAAFKVGDLVIVNGVVHRDSAGNGPGRTLSNHRGEITRISAGAKAPYHINSQGWVFPQAIGAAPAPKPVVIHTVRLGDTLGRIATRYNTTVDAIMKKNPHIKNRHLILPGWKIEI